MTVRASTIPVLVALLVGCGGWPSPNDFNRAPEGVISDRGITIADDGGRFRLVSGRPFRTPFWAWDCVRQPTPDNHALGERLGAQRVTVRHPAGTVHGLLAFCMLHPETTGAAARLYDVRIPDDKIAAAQGGLVSVVWEPTHMDLPAWVLWMSSRPFR